MLYKDRLKVEQDEALAAGDKEKKLAEIDAKLADLAKQAAAVASQ
jgi:hypothetical protein